MALTYANRTFPTIEVQSVSSAGTVTTFGFNAHANRGNFFGGFYVKVPQNVATSTNTVEFSTIGVAGSNIPLYLYNGTQATVAQLVTSGGGILLCFYDRSANRLQLLSSTGN